MQLFGNTAQVKFTVCHGSLESWKHRIRDMDENDFDDYERNAELALYREYRDLVATFKYVIETERRLYLANEVNLQRVDAGSDFYFELEMKDVWVWDIYRTDRFVSSVRVLTFKDVNVEELSGKAYELPKEFAVGE